MSRDTWTDGTPIPPEAASITVKPLAFESLLPGGKLVPQGTPTPQPPITDAMKRKAQKVARAMIAAERSRSAAESAGYHDAAKAFGVYVKRYARQLARLGVSQVSVRAKDNAQV